MIERVPKVPFGPFTQERKPVEKTLVGPARIELARRA